MSKVIPHLIFSISPLAALVVDRRGGNADGTCANLHAQYLSQGSGDGKSQAFVH